MSICVSFLGFVLKCILCVEDDEDRGPWRREDNYYALDRDYKSHTPSRSNAPLTRQYNSGQTTSSFRAHNDSQAKFTDAVSGAYAPKQPSISNRENIAKSLPSINLSGNRTRNDSQLSLASAQPVKQPSITSKPSLSPASEKPSEIYQKPRSFDSSSATANDTRKGTNSSKDIRHSSNVPLAASKQFQSCMGITFSSENSNSSFSEGKRDLPYYSCGNSDPPNPPAKSQSSKPPSLSTKPTISAEPSSSSSPRGKTTYTWVEKDASSTYVFPQAIKILIEKDIVPGVLKMPLSKSSYKDYFHALLYAEDCYLEKWDGFEMKNVEVQLHDAAIYTRGGKNRNPKEGVDKDEKVFVAFELEKIREKRPFLKSRDFVSLKPTKPKIKAFQGVIYRVVKSNLLLAEFGEEFHSHHHPNEIYDVKFSFNRVCLKRAHQAVAAASECLFRNLLFPNVQPKLELPSRELFPGYKYQQGALAVRQILRLQGLPPYLVEGPLAVKQKDVSKTGTAVVEAILGIFRADPSKKILMCAPVNRTCDLLMRGLKNEIAESEMFRANAAFRELDGVPMDILPSCLYKDDMKCFSCPSLKQLKKYKVILTTFMSSFRLYGEGIMAGHFSHIFLVDASSVTEPEAMVPLANFITEETIVVVTGEPGNHSGWIRSEIARDNGLMTSYFERLRNSDMYRELDPKVMVQLKVDPLYYELDIQMHFPQFN